MHSVITRLLPLLLLVMTAVPVAAQEPQNPQLPPPDPDRLPIGRIALDARVSIPRFKPTEVTAGALGVPLENLPTRGLGGTLGVHVYPFRLGKVTIGFGGEVMRSRGRRTADPVEEDGPEGPTVETSFSTVAPQVSLNFGHSEGWSFISGGIGWAKTTTKIVDETQGADTDEPLENTRAVNYGGGARWFMKKHLAFTVDFRFYNISPRVATATDPGHDRIRRMVISVGLSVK